MDKSNADRSPRCRRPLLIRRFAWGLCALVLIPLVVLTLYMLLGPCRQISRQAGSLYRRQMAENLDLIAEHFDYVSDTVTLLQDSQSLREQMQSLDNRNDGDEVRPVELYPFIGTPITFNNIRANRAVNAVTIFSGNDLVFYTLQQNSTDQPLSRCTNILYQFGTDAESGMFVMPGQATGYVYYVHPFRDIYRAKSYGTMILEINPVPTFTSADLNALPKAYQYQIDLSAYPGTGYVVYGEDGLIRFASDAIYVGTQVNNSLLSDLLADTDHYEILTESLIRPGLTVTFFTPWNAIYRQARQSQRTLLLLAAGVCVVVLLLSLLLLELLSRPLKALLQYCTDFPRQPKAPPAFDPVYRELEEVQQLIRGNLAEIEQLQGVIMKNHIQMKDAEIQLLQSQINPHFLFNMLDVIGWQALQDNSEGIREMVNYLGELLRSNILLSHQEKVTLRQELIYIKNYLSLQLIRYENSFSYTINVDDELLDSHYIPKLCLQPIVENSVVHGFKNLERPGNLQITIWEDMGEILCTIGDNGHGFDVKEFFEHPPETQPDNPKLNHIALQNIQNRIHMLCGPGFGISIESTPGTGTTVTVTLPVDQTPGGGWKGGGHV